MDRSTKEELLEMVGVVNQEMKRERGVRMKSLSVKLGIILVVIGLAIFASAEVWGEDWKLFKKTEDANFYYDKEDITRSPQKIVKVWIKQVYKKKGKMDMVNLVGARYENLSYSINSLEFDCGAKMVHFLSIAYHSKNGDVLDLENPPDKWESISPNSMFDVLYKKVCK
jgi:hypothetical protein